MLPRPSQDELTALLSALPERQRQVLLLRYGLQSGEPLSLRRVGRCLGITGERVRNMETWAFIRLHYQEDLTRSVSQPLVDALAQLPQS